MHEQVNYTVRWDQSCTLARSCFKARKTSHFLKDLNSAMSSGKHNALFRHSAIKLELPFLESLRLASSSIEFLELRVKMGLQIEAFLGWSPLTSLEVPVCSGFLGQGFSNLPFLSPLRALTSLTMLSLFVCGLSKGCVHYYKSKRAESHCHSWAAWAVSRSRRSGVFSSKPISAEE